jgi:molybdopterin/thiamine biosynthesis adenylyltransferase
LSDSVGLLMLVFAFAQAAKVLMDGAGVVGCAVLKTLALSSFSGKHIVLCC